MCALKSSIFENIFSGIEKAVNTFSIPDKNFPKMKIIVCPKHIRKILNKIQTLSILFSGKL